MMKKSRKLLLGAMCIGLSLSSVCGAGTQAATTGYDISNFSNARSVNTATMRLGFTISNSGLADISSGVVGKAGTSKIQLNVKIQKYNSSNKTWKKVKGWDKTVNSANATISTTYKLDTRGTYRCVLSATVWKNGSAEDVTMTSENKTY